MQNQTTDLNQSEDGDGGFEYMLCGGGFDRIPVQDTDSIVKNRRFGTACACCHCHRLGATRAGRMVEVELKRCRRLDERATPAQDAHTAPVRSKRRPSIW
jgi:hypothetical protein